MSMTRPPLKSSFAPVVDRDTRVLVLGSLPGEISLGLGRYYANPRNQFWRLMDAVTGSETPQTYPARLAHLLGHGIGLWDTVKSARRIGSLDGAIRDHEANALGELAARLPALRAIAFNGGAAARIGRARLQPLSGTVALVDLPSSSPAFTAPFDVKRAAWIQLRAYLQP